MPFGEKAGSVAVFLPVVICSSPAPFVCTRKSCAAVCPSRVAEKTIQRVGLEAPEAA
ncbi:MAG: hypothetical protein ACXVZ2_05180 [Gaiellaceae bacterium]